MMIEASFGTFAPFDKLVRGIFAEQMHATTALFSRRAPLSCHKSWRPRRPRSTLMFTPIFTAE